MSEDAVRVTVFALNGARLAEIEPAIESVAWRLSNVGLARFFMPYRDPKCTPDVLAYGNRVLIEFSNGLPDWGGVIDVPRRRERHGVTVTAYSGERLLDWRRTAKARYFSQEAPGVIAETLVQEVNVAYPSGVEVASGYGGGTVRTLEYHYHDVLQRMLDLRRLTNHDFAVLPQVVGGVLQFVFNWYEQRGSDKSAQVVLREGSNVEALVLDEQGPLMNQVYLIGEGSTWGAQRLVGTASDTAARDVYGYREYAEVQSGVRLQETLDANAAALLAAYSTPRMAYSLRNVVSRAPGEFVEYEVGDTVQLQGLFDGGAWPAVDVPVRVIAREWLPTGMCQLEVA